MASMLVLRQLSRAPRPSPLDCQAGQECGARRSVAHARAVSAMCPERQRCVRNDPSGITPERTPGRRRRESLVTHSVLSSAAFGPGVKGGTAGRRGPKSTSLLARCRPLRLLGLPLLLDAPLRRLLAALLPPLVLGPHRPSRSDAGSRSRARVLHQAVVGVLVSQDVESEQGTRREEDPPHGIARTA
jgi:hypothetical protein